MASKNIRLYGSIGAPSFFNSDTFDEHSFIEMMKGVDDNDDLNIFLNSDGGSVFSAMAIYQIIKRHKGQVNITVDGIAASAATIITSAPNAKVIMPTGSMLMIHNPSRHSGLANAKQLREFADALDKVGGSIASVYRAKTKLPESKINQMLSKDTYLSAEEAVQLGFADELSFDNPVQPKYSDYSMNFNGIILNFASVAEIKKNCYKDNNEIKNQEGVNKMSEKENVKAEEGKQPVEQAPINDSADTIKFSAITVDILKNKCPDLYKSIVDSAVKDGIMQERNRIKAIEEMAIDGHEKETIKAKFEDAISPEAYAIAMMKAEKANRQAYLAARNADASALQNAIVDSANTGLTNKHAEDEAKKLEEEKAIIEAGLRGFSCK